MSYWRVQDADDTITAVAMMTSLPIGLPYGLQEGELVVMNIVAETFIAALRDATYEFRNLPPSVALDKAYKQLETICLTLPKKFVNFCTTHVLGQPEIVDPEARRVRSGLFEMIFEKFFGADFDLGTDFDFKGLKYEANVFYGTFNAARGRFEAKYKFENLFRDCYSVKAQFDEIFEKIRVKAVLYQVSSNFQKREAKYFAALLWHCKRLFEIGDYIHAEERSNIITLTGKQLALRALENELDLQQLDQIYIDRLIRRDGTIFDGRRLFDVIKDLSDLQLDRLFYPRYAQGEPVRIAYGQNPAPAFWLPIARRGLAINTVDDTLLWLAPKLARDGAFNAAEAETFALALVHYLMHAEYNYPRETWADEIDWAFNTSINSVAKLDHEELGYLLRKYYNNVDVIKTLYRNNQGPQQVGEWRYYVTSAKTGYRWRIPALLPNFDDEIRVEGTQWEFAPEAIVWVARHEEKPTPEDIAHGVKEQWIAAAHAVSIYFFMTETSAINSLSAEDAAWVRSIAQRHYFDWYVRDHKLLGAWPTE